MENPMEFVFIFVKLNINVDQLTNNFSDKEFTRCILLLHNKTEAFCVNKSIIQEYYNLKCYLT